MQSNFNHNAAPRRRQTGAWLIGLWTVLECFGVCLPALKSGINCSKKSLFSLQQRLRPVFIPLIFTVVGLSMAGPAYSAITKVKDIGTNSLTTNGTSISLTVPAAGVAAGNSIIVTFAMVEQSGTISCADQAGNPYSVDVEAINNNNVRTAVCAAHNVSALSSGQWIQVTHPTVTDRMVYAGEFSGLATSSTLDQTNSTPGNATAMTSGIVTTTEPKELLIGAIGVAGPTSDGFTHGSGWTGLTQIGTSNITLNSQYQIVSSTAGYNAGGTNGVRRKYGAGIASYMAPPAYLDQVHYRWRNDDGTETGASWVAGVGEDTKLWGIQKSIGIHRLRFLVANEGIQNPAVTYQLQVAETATCSSGTYGAVPTDATGDFQIVGSQLADGAATSSTVTGLTDPGGYTWVDGEQEENSNTTDSITLDEARFTEIEFSIQATSNATSEGNYCFKLVKSGSGDLDNYTFYAEGVMEPATAITLVSFAATGEGNSVRVDWQTAQEIRNLGFNLYRSTSPDGPFIKLNDSLIPGLEFSVKGKSYRYIDSAVTPGTLYYYQLEDIDASGKRTFHGPVCVDWDADGIPDDWEMAHGLNPWVNDADVDADDDGLTNRQEYDLGTDPFNPDSDGDGILDGLENRKIEHQQISGSKTLTPGVQILAEDETGMTLELHTDSFDTEVVTAGGEEFERLRIVDYIHGHTREVGKPEMPVKGILLDIPQDKIATLSIQQTEVEIYTGYRILPVPESVVDDQGSTAAVGESFVWNQIAYALDAFYPQDVARLGDVFVFRGQNKQQVLFQPFAFNPVSSELRHYRKILVRIDYDEGTLAKADTYSPEPWQLPVTSGAPDSFASIGHMAMAFGAAPLITNPISPLLSSLGALVNTLWSPDTGAQGTAYKIYVEQEGIYRLTRDYLVANGVDVAAMDLSQIRIYNLGEEVALSVYDQNTDNILDAADYIEFYGRPVTALYAKYARDNVYWLVTAGGMGSPKRTADVDGVPAAGPLAATHSFSAHHEEDEYYVGLAPGDDSLDRWFFDDFVLGTGFSGTPDPVPIDFTVNLPGIAGHGSIKISMWGYYDTYHEIEVWVNGNPAGIFNWTGIAFYEATIDEIDLLDGDNTISLACNRELDGIIVDWLEITYPRTFEAANNTLRFSHDSGFRYQIDGFTSDTLMVFDITQTSDVGRVANVAISGSNPYTLEFEPPVNPGATATYLVLESDASMIPVGLIEDTAADLADNANGADYILITHRDLGWNANSDAYGWLNDLVALREDQGLRVKVVDVADIFDEFSYGLTSAEAIRDFLNYAYTSWEPPAPQYVLIVGDSTYDFRDNLQLGIINYVPAYLRSTPYMGETVTDEWFVKISGNDAVPDLYIGRLPAQSAAEAAIMVNKILTYETTPNDKTWQKNTLLIADNQTEAYEASFELMNEEAAMLLPASMNVPFKGYLNDYLTAAALRDDIKATIDAGTLIVNYSGHGSLQRLTGEGIFQNSDVDDLTNTGKYPFVISMSCLTGYFGYLDPQDGPEPSLAEALLRADGKGAVASLMPTGMTPTGGQHILDTALFESIFTKDIRQLGPAVVDAKQTLLANGGTAFEEVSETFLLFGDPALTLQVPIPYKPTEVDVQQVEEGIVISWQSVEDCDGNPVAGYNVYRSPSAGGVYTKINGILVTDTQYLDTDPAGISAQDLAGSGAAGYFYGVTSVDSGGDESAQSLAISPPSLATGFGAADVGAAGCFIATSTSPAAFNITFDALIAIVSIILAFLLLQSIFNPSRQKNTVEKKMNPFNELKNVKTLLVDDDEFIRNSLELAFKTKGCWLLFAGSRECRTGPAGHQGAAV
jgi:hypothetical protein